MQPDDRIRVSHTRPDRSRFGSAYLTSATRVQDHHASLVLLLLPEESRCAANIIPWYDDFFAELERILASLPRHRR